jgi:hypothetical protein
MRKGHPLEFVSCYGVVADRHQHVQRVMGRTLPCLPLRHQLVDLRWIAGDARNEL